jgi:nitrate reductase NapA
MWAEFKRFGDHHGHDYAEFDTYHEVRGLRWPW